MATKLTSVDNSIEKESISLAIRRLIELKLLKKNKKC
jgi:hypothetical protein